MLFGIIFNIGEGCVAVNVWFSCAQEVQVGAVDEEDRFAHDEKLLSMKSGGTTTCSMYVIEFYPRFNIAVVCLARGYPLRCMHPARVRY